MRRTIRDWFFYLLRWAIFIALCLSFVGCGDNEAAGIQCVGTMRAYDPATGWTCGEVEQLGLWSCTCYGPGQISTVDICAVAKGCQ